MNTLARLTRRYLFQDGLSGLVEAIGCGVRHGQAVLILTCFTVAFYIRASMSVAVIAMTDISAKHKGEIKIFEWNKQIQDYLLSSFYVGYMIMQLPGGQLAQRFGGKRMIFLALLVNGGLSLALPTLATWGGWAAVYGCRIAQGLTQGFFVPSIHTLIGKWAPVNERNRIGNFVYTGYNLGTIAAMLASGKLAATRFGWPLIFYSGGALSLGAALLWALLGAESPKAHKGISLEEKLYIETSLNLGGKEKPSHTPWRSMLKSRPLGALLVAHIGGVWGSMLLLTETPSFMKMALGINVENSGLLSALPYVCGFASTVLASALADMAVNRRLCSITTVRKVANTIGTWGPATGLILLTFIPPERAALAVALIALIGAFDSIGSLGFMLNHIDLSPNYAGLLVSFTNCCAAGLANLAPITAGFILREGTDITRWRLVFLVAAVAYFVSNCVFLAFGSGERQPWDSVDVHSQREVTVPESGLESAEHHLLKKFVGNQHSNQLARDKN